MIRCVRSLVPEAKGDASFIIGTREKALELLGKIQPDAYAQTRNHVDGAITRLSPYIQHGLVSLAEVRDAAIARANSEDLKFFQELSWREFWQLVLDQHPDWAWNDAEAYKTGFGPEDYAKDLPEDIDRGQTGVACIDAFIAQLHSTGYLHNHARMYVASYVVHFRRIRWQAGARWFLNHLLDANLASNNLSWQWVASTFSQKPYVFNLESVAKYFGASVDTTRENNRVIDASYDQLKRQLFPHSEVL